MEYIKQNNDIASKMIDILNKKDYEKALDTLSDDEFENIFNDPSNYNEIFKSKRNTHNLMYYLQIYRYEILERCLDINFWKTFANLPQNFHSIVSNMGVNCKNVFSVEKLTEMISDAKIRQNLFQYVYYQFKKPVIDLFLEKLHSKKITNSEMDVVRDIIQYAYSPTGPINSSVLNEDLQIDGGVLPDSIESNKKPKGFTDYSSFVQNRTNNISLAYLFNDLKLRKLFIYDFALLSSLSKEDRSKLYSMVNFDELNEIELQNVQKLLINGYLTEFDSNLIKNDRFIEMMINNTDVTTFRMCVRTLKLTNPELSEGFMMLKRAYLYDKLFVNQKINKENYPYVKYENGEQDLFVNCLMYRYFKTCPNDIYVSAKLIADSLQSLPSIQQSFPNEMMEIIDCLIHIANRTNSKGNSNFTQSKLNHIKDIRLVLKLKNVADKYIQNYGEIDLESVVEVCKKAFTSNLANGLTNKQSKGVELRNINGVEVYDITQCDNFHLLIHATSQTDLVPITKGNEPLVSMSVLDNNHLHTYADYNISDKESTIILGFDNISKDSIVHAYTENSTTGNGKTIADMIYARVTNLAPVYTDLESFMNATDMYNEIKIKATPNAQNKNNQAIMKPSYILYKADNIQSIPQKVVEVATEIGCDIYIINTDMIKRKEYSPIIKPDEINHGIYQS